MSERVFNTCTVQQSEMMGAQRLCNLTSEVLHSLSHVYHHVSDLMVDMSQAPPRNLRAPPPMPTTAIIQQTIPVQVQHLYNEVISVTFILERYLPCVLKRKGSM